MAGSKIAVFGGGCFWCLEPVFENLEGVKSVEPGYAGGKTRNPTYEQVCEGGTDHAEVVKIEFDPDIISFNTLLEVFFSVHDPTTPNRQGADIGRQYRSIILYKDSRQKEMAQEFIADLEKNKVYPSPVVTQVEKLDKYYRAEDYHIDYYRKNKSKPYCQFIISPKLKKLNKNFQHLLK